MDERLADDVAEASAVYGAMQLANWLPADRHADLRELLHDLAYTAIVAYVDARRRRRCGPGPEPSPN